jgi:glycosyltransferase involved in cell wall biosynthesis
MKTLLLTDIPPSSNLTAGIVTAQMCRFIPPHELAIFCVQNPHLRPKPYPEFDAVPLKTVRKPNELSARDARLFPLDRIASIATETGRRFTQVPLLVRQAIAFGRAQEVTSLWVVLQGQTMVRMASAVAQGLDIPLRTQVWDPLGWWLLAHGVDRFNRKVDLAAFDAALRQATSCATASWAMSREYEKRYGTECHAVIASLDESVARRPPPALRTDDELVIGMAGQFYAEQEWHDLLRALNFSSWQIGGRKIVLRVAGYKPPQTTGVPDANVEFLGWRSQAELVQLLSETCDVLYCPYPFAPAMEEVARLSFPSKIPTYLAAGRPILFHGPEYASPAVYLRERGAGLICRAKEPDAVFNGLLHLVENTALYAQIAAATQAAFLADFTLRSMRQSVRRFLGYSD